MTDYTKTIQQLTNIRNSLQNQLSEIKNAAAISYSSWDSDARNAYQSAINAITREINSISVEVDNLKRYIYKEDDAK